ncbi:Alanine--tRNA ligase [Anaerolineales bacterium]|nr:Alanine--tRNA ligase [Anaerolineales bacterium]
MIDPSIPMSFVMSAGLVQVENSLAKSTKREGNRYVLVQECFRHFDLEKVGTDDVHLSLFEMPGAFVFGPDGKSGTVKRMWALATSILGLDKENIWSTYFSGGKVADEYLPEDTVTQKAWLETDIPSDHIVGLGTENNYWIQGRGISDIGDLRKCGPNTELFYDRGIDKKCNTNCIPGCKCGRFVEFSNSLFINTEIKENGKSLQPLGNPFTETVIGTERIAMINQGLQSVFEIDSINPLITTIRQFAPKTVSLEASSIHERVIADHLRGLYFLIADGAPPPGKDGRARIIKMLIRRVATRLIVLGIDPKIILSEMLNCISLTIPENAQKEKTKEKVISFFLPEYERFSKTIKRGELKLTQLLIENNGKTLSGLQIACLEKQWGMPSLLVAMILNKLGLSFEEDEYKSIEAKEISALGDR